MIYCCAIYHLAMIKSKVYAEIIRKHIVDVYYTLHNNFAFDISRRRNSAREQDEIKSIFSSQDLQQKLYL